VKAIDHYIIWATTSQDLGQTTYNSE